jgi:hypothetical protein
LKFDKSIKQKQIKMNTQILSTRLITNSDIVVSVVMVKRTEKTAFVQIEKGEIVRCKVKKSYDGKEYIMPYGTYSMAPMFYVN